MEESRSFRSALTHGQRNRKPAESPFAYPARGAGVSSPGLSLPNMVTAAAGYGFGWVLLGQLLFADRARFSHHVRHGLYS